MASLFKMKFKRWRDADGRPCKRNTPGATFVMYEPDEWYGRYVDHEDILQRMRLATDKSAAQQMLAAKIKEVERRKSGLVDHFTDHAKDPIKVHLEAYRTFLQLGGHVAMSATRSATAT